MKHFVPQHELPKQAEALRPEEAPVVFSLDKSSEVNGGIFVSALSSRCLQLIDAVVPKIDRPNQPKFMNSPEYIAKEAEFATDQMLKLIVESGGCNVLLATEENRPGFTTNKNGKSTLALSKNGWETFKSLISNIKKGELEYLETRLVRGENFEMEDIDEDALAQKIGKDKVDRFLEDLKNPSFKAQMDADFLKKSLDIVQPPDQTAANITNQLTPAEGEVWPMITFKSSVKTLLKENVWDMPAEKCRVLKVLYKDLQREIARQQRAQGGTTTEEPFVPDLIETRITHFKGLVLAGILILDPVIESLGARKKQLGEEIKNRVASALKVIKTDPKTKSLKIAARLVDIEQVREALMKIDFTVPLNHDHFALMLNILQKEGITGNKAFDAFFSEKLAPLFIKLCTNENNELLLDRIDKISEKLPEQFKEVFSRLVIKQEK